MLDLFSGQHILILLAVALVVVGPKDLPKMMHMAGKWAGNARAMANEFKRSFDDMARQAELDALRKEIEGMRGHEALADVSANFNPRVEAAAPPPGVDVGAEPRAGEPTLADAMRSTEPNASEAFRQ